jgi:hypothetical protein
MVVVADAGMLSATNLKKLDEAGLRFIVGSRVTKAPVDLASHFRRYGDAFTDAQLTDTITPKEQPGHGERPDAHDRTQLGHCPAPRVVACSECRLDQTRRS